MTSRRNNSRPHGQIRQSQLITTFGPGAMIDLPNRSVILGGLEHWSYGGEEIVERRLCKKLCKLLEIDTINLRTPPPDPDDPTAPQTGVTAFQFPEWFITQDITTSTSSPNIRSRRLVHRKGLTRGKFVDDNRKRRSVVPIRFVRACRSGHIGDIDWYSFVHGNDSNCARPLWIDERGTSGDLTEVYVRCECKREKSVAQASIIQNRALGSCDGSRPWLGPYSRETCGEPNRLLIRTASNAYFSQVLTVISLPERDDEVTKAVDSVWEFLSEVEDIEQLKYERKKARVNAALEDMSDEEVFQDILARRSPELEVNKSVKKAELETLISSKNEIGEDKPDGDFFARALPGDQWNKQWMKNIERVVLVHRLREVAALVGFTRFEALSPNSEGELELGVRRASLARELKWLPAIENKGEGIFIQIGNEVLHDWLERPQVKLRGEQLLTGFNSWKTAHNSSKREFPGLPFIMVHSLSHLLITSVSLECGYPASSIRERIYAIPDVGFGILLYTGSTDSEGTLGGLIEVGRKIHRHLKTAMELGELCSNDPVCAQHHPNNQLEQRFLVGAACHGCLLIAESSCEQHNDFLDRALVVPTVDNQGAEFLFTT